MERTCLGCHHVQFFPYNQIRGYPGGRQPHDKDSWALTVDRMHMRVEGAPAGKASYFKTELLPPVDRDTLIDYLAENFWVRLTTAFSRAKERGRTRFGGPREGHVYRVHIQRRLNEISDLGLVP